MRKILMLAAANIRKSKSQAVSLLLFVLIAAMFLNIGLVMYFGFGSFFDERAEQLNTPHYSAIQLESFTTDEQIRYLENYPGVTDVETQSALAGVCDYFIGGSKNQGAGVFARADDTQRMNPPSLIGDFIPLTGDAIYIPYSVMLDGGYKIGDDFKLLFVGTEFHFTVAGATEEIMFGSMMTFFLRFYVSDEKYLELESVLPESRSRILSVRMNKPSDGLQLDADYLNEFYYGEDAEISTDALAVNVPYVNIKDARIQIPMISAIIITAFAMSLLAVSLIVIRFRIVNSIEEGMTNIGALKAVGYRNGQIIGSIITQFGSIAIIGGILGIVLSQVFLPTVAKLLESQIALVWKPAFDTAMALVSLIFVLLLVIGVSYLSARRIRKLHPLTALRGGILTHSFKKNVVPLDTSRGALPLLLAMKQLAGNKKQVITIAVAVAAVTFAAIFGISMHYNLSIEKDAFVGAIAGEAPDAAFGLLDSKETLSFEKRLLARTDVRKAFGFQNPVSIMINGNEISASVVEDCALLEGSMLVSGRYPKHSNEIAIGAAAAKLLGKSIGDTVTVTIGSREKEYLITGMIQIMNSGGMNAVIAESGLREIQPEYECFIVYVYLTAGTDTAAFLESVKEDEGDIFATVINIDEQLDAQLGSMGDVFAVIAAGILAVTAIVVMLVLYMVIKATILHRKRELGIQKALGFTTFQLMNQVALHFTPIILFGVALGAVGGYFGLNPLFVALTSSMGAVQANLTSPLSWVLATGLALCVLAYAVSMLVAWNIRKISAYSLISE